MPSHCRRVIEVAGRFARSAFAMGDLLVRAQDTRPGAGSQRSGRPIPFLVSGEWRVVSGVVPPPGVVPRSPDRGTGPTAGLLRVPGDLRSGQVARSGDRATTRFLPLTYSPLTNRLEGAYVNRMLE